MVYLVNARAKASMPNQLFAGRNAIDPLSNPRATRQGFDEAPAGTGSAWQVGYPPQTRCTHVISPKRLERRFREGRRGPPRGLHRPSRHSCGVNVLCRDGPGRPIEQTISTQTWWALGVTANNEAISADTYSAPQRFNSTRA